MALLADAGDALSAMLEILPAAQQARDDWCQYAIDTYNGWRTEQSEKAESPSEGVHPARVMESAGEVVSDDALISLDVGDSALWFGAHFPAKSQEVLVSGMWRTLGFALPAALSGQIAYPDRPVLAVTGDAGFLGSASELTSAVKHQLPVVVLVLDNRKMAIEEHEQMKMGIEPTEVRMPKNLPLAGVAQSLGADAFSVQMAQEMRSALQQAFNNRRPAVIEVPVQAPAPPEVRRQIDQIMYQQ